MERLPTVSDVAEAAGVSRQTVSNVVNAPHVVREETRERVQGAIDRLQYRPHASARRLRTQKSSTLGVRLDPVLEGMAGSLLDRFLHALTEQAEARDLRVLLYTAADAEAEVRQFRRLLDGVDVDGFVLTSTGYDDARIAWLLEHQTPFVTFGRPWGVDDMGDPLHLWVDVDGHAGVAEATAHLLAGGARRVVFLGWPAGSGTGDDRRRGWRDAMLAAAGGADRSVLDRLDLEVRDDRALGAAAVVGLQAAGVEFDAVVCASDTLALGAVTALGPGVPVIGYDDTPVARAMGFPSVAQPLDEVAAGVLNLLDGAHGGRAQGAEGVDDPRHRLIRPHLALR